MKKMVMLVVILSVFLVAALLAVGTTVRCRVTCERFGMKVFQAQPACVCGDPE